jgi:replicative DNA helicase
MCLESAELGHKGDALTLPKLAEIFKGAEASGGLMARLRQIPRYGTLVDAMGTYANRLLLTSASGDLTSINQIQNWVELTLKHGLPRLLVVVDYLQKIPIQGAGFQSEIEETTFLAHRLKEMAKSLQVAVVAIAAADRAGLKSKRMRFWDLRGSSALQYEADVGMMLNNKFTIISREHMVYNPAQAENLRGWVVMSIEKNRSGLGMVDMEYAFDPAHFRFVREGGFVRERLVDDKLVLQ